MATRLVSLPGQVANPRVVEETDWHQLEPACDAGLNREILGSRDVMQAEDMPSNQVRLNQWGVTVHEMREAIGSVALVNELARGESLIGVKRCHPKIVVGIACTPS